MPSFRVRFFGFGLAITWFCKNTKHGSQRPLDGTTRERFPTRTNHFPTFLREESLQAAQVLPIVGDLFLKPEKLPNLEQHPTSPTLHSKATVIEKGANTNIRRQKTASTIAWLNQPGAILP
jgi:hypothetical protein